MSLLLPLQHGQRHCLSKKKNKHGHRHTHFDKHCSANYVEKVLSKQLLLTVSLSFLKDQGFFFYVTWHVTN
jgi:hypothetical protein